MDEDNSPSSETQKLGIRASYAQTPEPHAEPPFLVRIETGSLTDESVRQAIPEPAIQATLDHTVSDSAAPVASCPDQPYQAENCNAPPTATAASTDPSPETYSIDSTKQEKVDRRKGPVPWWIRAGKPNPGIHVNKGRSSWNKGKRNPRWIGNTYGSRWKGIPKSDEWKRKARLAKIGERNPMKNPIYAKRMAESKTGKSIPKLKEFWRLHHDEQIKRMMVGEHKKPNKLERRLTELIDKNGLPFRYVGNWEFMVAGKCPDFLNTDGRKLLIELFGNYWHTVKARETVEERVERFRKHGFETLVLWEKEMDDEQLIVDKIRQFAGKS
jgi:G:T-mismatch repair DNA endonuclease (very short patch repair protein)